MSVLVLLGNVKETTKTHFRTVGPALAVCLEPVAHRLNVVSLSLLYSHYFCRCSGLTKLVSLHFSRGRSTRYPDKLRNFSVTHSRCCKEFHVNNLFPRTA